jgi:lipid II:glycine glycyltransferase (peptidoglycan interpeptide bridge formation enzyme)
MPSFITIGAFVDDRLVAAHIWLKHGDIMYSHLAASNQAGYECGASYALYANAIERFDNCRVFDLGGVPDGKKSLGLAKFKRGFANDERTNWLCGWVFNQPVYDELCSKNNLPKDDLYFPSYRRGL